MLDDEMKQEMLETSKSEELKNDMAFIRKNLHNPYVINGTVKLDRVVDFLTQANEFMNHRSKIFRKINCNNNKL